MNLEILLGGLVGLSLIAILIFLVTGRDAFGEESTDASPWPNSWGDEEDSDPDQRR
ncbi:hypothetical protein [Jannaschia formosa]|uniref:hypothetical protein n=1 Tax=Jannaschia formosa TaxID=2259592 RepID=UPI001431A969|nr:hypothetical protein [Jannaschia formosa]